MQNQVPWITIITQVGSIIIASLLTHYLTLRKVRVELLQEYNKKFNQKRWEVYIEFIEYVSFLIHNDTDHQNYDDIFKQQKLSGIEQKILLIGSNELIKALGEWKVVSRVNGGRSIEAVDSMTKVINLMRNDLGEPNELFKEQILNIIHPGYQRSM